MDKSALFVLIYAYMKACSKCKIEKGLDCFSKQNGRAFGRASQCKLCQKKSYKKHRAANIESERKRGREYMMRPEQVAKKKLYDSTPEMLEKKRALGKVYYAKNRKKVLANTLAYKRKRTKEDVSFKLISNYRRRVRQFMKASSHKRNSPIMELLGCSGKELKKHIELQWVKGMTWENYGLDGWHIDHTKSLASIDITDDKQLREVLHYTNLQPLWWRDNISKGAKTDWVKLPHYNIK